MSCLRTSQEKELERVARVSDQMVTAHAALRDMYRRRALLLDALLLACAIAVCTLALADLRVVEDMLGLSPDRARAHLAIFSSLLFFAVLIQAKVDWKGKADEHDRASQSYAAVKLMTGRFDPGAGPAQHASFTDVRAQYTLVGQTSIPLPDGRFLALKALHRRKVALSKCLDRYPNASVRIVALAGKIRETMAALRQFAVAASATRENGGQDPGNEGS